MHAPQRPSHAQATFPLLIIFDDSLHNRWADVPAGARTNLSALPDSRRSTDGRHVPCSHSLRAEFNDTLFNGTLPSSLLLRADEPVVLSSSTPLLLSFVWAVSPPRGAGPRAAGSCPAAKARGVCHAAVCVSVRTRATADADSFFMPLCAGLANADVGGSRGAGNSTPVRAGADGLVWRQAQIPLSEFGLAGRLEEIVLRPGTASPPTPLLPLSLRLDDVWLAAEHSPRAGDFPPSYGASDMNMVRQNWLQGVSRRGAADSQTARNNPHFCKYMSSELGHAARAGADADASAVAGGGRRPLCKVDGDHLRGRWMQTCDPRLITRPDHFAYGRALPPVRGWYDYRLCFRQSATERLRTLQAVSWSWRPYACALAPVRGAAFDAWLGNRTLLFLGDSLTAQSYYSLLWLLGGVVVRQRDLHGRAPGEAVMRTVRLDKCESSVGNEGGYVSMAHLRGGGRIVKVMRHVELVDELNKVAKAFWVPWLQQADLVVFNVGHHYHSRDPRFENYSHFAKIALKQLGRLSRPTAQLIFRTTNIGHHACENATRPLRSRYQAWQQLSSGPRIFEWRPRPANVSAFKDLFKDKYSWRGPPIHEPAWPRMAARLELSARFTMLNVSFMDARADGHVANSMRYSSLTGRFGAHWKRSFPLDCLHYCYPGPADFWALALYNLLLNNPRFSAGARVVGPAASQQQRQGPTKQKKKSPSKKKAKH